LEECEDTLHAARVFPFAATTQAERRESFMRSCVTGLAHTERASIPPAPSDQRITPERQTGNYLQSIPKCVFLTPNFEETSGIS